MMSEPKSICILGRLPALGTAELERLYGAEHIRPAGGAVLLDLPAEEINFKRLGGTIKTARILSQLESSDWPSAYKFLCQSLPQHLENIDSKLTLGVSVYGLEVDVKQLQRNLLGLKKLAKTAGKSLRIVPNKMLALNSAQVLHNQLTKKGGWELLFVRDGKKTILAQTLFVQDIEAYGARDQARPFRDARVGMLPPKLAQTIINLGIGNIYEMEAKNGQYEATILDPFCGTGVILQEALLMGYQAIGSDINPQMVDYSIKNIQWLHEKIGYTGFFRRAVVADAASGELPDIESVDAVVSETYLGRPLNSLPALNKLQEIINDTNTIIQKFLANVGSQLKPGTRMCLAVPAWRKPSGELMHLPCLAKLTEMGYNYVDLKNVRRDELVYYREGQTVARQLIILEKV